MKKLRLVFLIVIMVSGTGITAYLAVNNVRTAHASTLAPFYQALGNGSRIVNKTFGRLLPVDEMDEGEYGQIIRQIYDSKTDRNDPSFLYLNSVMDGLQANKKNHSATLFILSILLIPMHLPCPEE